MADIITADNLPLVVGAVLSGLAGLAVWKQGGKLGEQARSERPPSPDAVIAGGLMMSNVGSADMIGALRDIAKAVREATDEARAARSSRTESVLSRIEDKLEELDGVEKGRWER
jgi:hypothetical protein